MTLPADTDPAFTAYAHPERLVSTQWLADHLGEDGLVVVESDEDVLLYETGHIEGAVKIECVAMTGLATGVGAVSPEVCASQMARAFAHYHEATAKPEKWGALGWRDIFDMPV